MGLSTWLFLIPIGVLVALVPTYLEKSALPYPNIGRQIVELSADVLPSGNVSLQGPLEPNALLKNATRLFDGVIKGSETVAFTPSGSMLLMDKYGYVHEAVEDSAAVGGWSVTQKVAYLGVGRPLGSHVDHAGNLYVCDALKGLIMLPAGPHPQKVVLLTSRVSSTSPLEPDTPITYANDLDIASDGSIYFTDSQTIPPALTSEGAWDTFRSFTAGLHWGNFTGRLLRYDPLSGETVVLATGFWFSNGVALAADESFLVVAETNRHRIMRHWLKGPQAGTVDQFSPELPGFPDGVSRAPDGGFWVAIAAPPSKMMKLAANTLVRSIVARLPPYMQPPITKWGAVAKLSASGEILGWLLDEDGSHIATLASVYEHKGRLYCGTVVNSYITVVDLPDFAKA